MASERFTKNNKLISHLTKISFSLVIFVMLVFLFIFSLNSMSKDTGDRQEEALNNAIGRAIISCYCIEGTYPPSLDYIIDKYGLTYDSDLFFVDYQAIGSNILPDVTIIRKDR